LEALDVILTAAVHTQHSHLYFSFAPKALNGYYRGNARAMVAPVVFLMKLLREIFFDFFI